MQTQITDIKAQIAALRTGYTRLALQCRAAGIRVDPKTVEHYLQEIKCLEAQLK